MTPLLLSPWFNRLRTSRLIVDDVWLPPVLQCSSACPVYREGLVQSVCVDRPRRNDRPHLPKTDAIASRA